MALPDFSMRQLLEAGCHFGHQTHRWNPKMSRYIFGSRNNIHIIDLSQTVPLMHQALKTISDVVAGGGRVLFVGTKRQASEIIADAAKRSAQYYVNARWLGGMLTNWSTISNSIKRLRQVEELLDSPDAGQFTKKERLMLTRERDKLERALGGIKDMGGTPDLLFVVDTNKESIAVKEARRLNIPVVAVLDTNCDPDTINYPIPGNDDAARAIALYCELVAKAAIDGIARQQGGAGVDLGAAVEAPVEPALAAEEEAAAEPAAQPVEAPGEPAKAEAAPETEAAPGEPAKAEAAPEAEAAPGEPAKAEEGPAAPAEAEETPVADAVPAAEEETGEAEQAPLFAAPEGEPDDLKKISGVGPVLEKKLHALGITKFDQVAGFSAEEIVKVDDALNFKGRIERDDWIGQAKALAAGE
ncbi:MAG: 30S ribosomal protein S2 [Salaquimonas sp.]|nr:30S ribosomal protein S2 [Salaquimonas sp.]